MTRRLRIATRHWDHVLPLALADVGVGDREIAYSRRDVTPNLTAEPDLDVAETSFSGYLHRRAQGDTTITALPVFVMAGFRHRCVITRGDGPTSFAELDGGTVGLTGWPDSGNVWTRALLLGDGVRLSHTQWRVGPLTSAHPETDRIGRLGAPPNVRHTASGETLVDGLLEGDLDAVLTPFLPPGFDHPDSGLRPLLPNVRAAEVAYFEKVRYLPGIHVLAVRTELLEHDSTLATDLVQAFDRAKRLSWSRHLKLGDVTPWSLQEWAFATRTLGEDWMPYGWSANAAMVEDFLEQQRVQGLLEDPRLGTSDLFPDEVRLEP